MKKNKDKDQTLNEELEQETTVKEKTKGGKEKKPKKGKKAAAEKAWKEEKEKLEQELGEMKDKFLRLAAEFDNFKRRNAKERIELMKTAGQDLIIDLLPVLDDFDRSEKMRNEDLESKVAGFQLIRSKLFKVLEAKGMKNMEAQGEDFNPEFHEAITEIPAPDKKLKGKVVDVIEEGYYLNEKIIRYAKVVVGK